ncbi:MAG: hypothetical protein Q8M09_04615 [Pseudomonadota bacterium]|nr:hypothetical protein [Pseudomonadota bacterium]MDP2354096.1 hypothetical protein [Pseudomonadota bacterium]
MAKEEGMDYLIAKIIIGALLVILFAASKSTTGGWGVEKNALKKSRRVLNAIGAIIVISVLTLIFYVAITQG